MEVSLVADGKVRLFLSKSRKQCCVVLCFPVSKGICSLIRYRKQLATCCWEPMEREYTFYQLCFPYPLVAFAGCGNRHHSGHCCSEIAFTDQSTRRSCIQPGEPGALHCRIVHRDGQCTLSLVWTQRAKERFYCKVWQVLFADDVGVHMCVHCSLDSFSFFAYFLLQQFHYVGIILHFN